MGGHFALFKGTLAWNSGPNFLLTPVADTVIPALGAFFQLPRDLQCIGAAAGATPLSAATLAQLAIPARPDLIAPAITPAFELAPSGGNPRIPEALDLSMHPIQLRLGDPVGVMVNDPDLADPDSMEFLVAVFLADRLDCPGSAPIFWLPYSCAGTDGAAADRWQTVALDFAANRLPAGRYNVLSVRHAQAGVDAARLVLPNQVWRPGAFTLATRNAIAAPALPRPEASGVLGTFDAIAPPAIELYAPATTPGLGSGFLLLQRADDGPTRGCGCGAGAGPCACGGACRRR